MHKEMRSSRRMIICVAALAAALFVALLCWVSRPDPNATEAEAQQSWSTSQTHKQLAEDPPNNSDPTDQGHREAQAPPGRVASISGIIISADKHAIPVLRIYAKTQNKKKREQSTIAYAEARPDSAASFMLTIPLDADAQEIEIGAAPCEDYSVLKRTVHLPRDVLHKSGVQLLCVHLNTVIEGTVTTALGRPAAHAAVRTSYAETLADESGYYRVKSSTNISHSLFVTASMPGYSRVETMKTVAQGATKTRLDIVLPEQKVLRGRIVSANDHPIPNCVVSLEGDLAESTTSDKNGKFEINLFQPFSGPSVLLISCDQYIAARTQLSENDVQGELMTFVLNPARPLTGAIISETGSAIADANVIATALAPPNLSFDAVSDTQGLFSFAELPNCAIRLTASRSGFATAQRVIDNSESSTPDLKIQLSRGRAIKGRVRSARAEPVSCSIRIRCDGSYIGTGQRVTADGSFALLDVPLERVELECYGKSIARKTVRVPDRVDLQDVAIEVTTSGIMAGTVLDAETRVPLVEFNVKVCAPDLGPGEHAAGVDDALWTDVGGKPFYSAIGAWNSDGTSIRPGLLGLEISAEGYAPRRISRLEIGEGRVTETGEVLLRKAGRLRGTILGFDVTRDSEIRVCAVAKHLINTETATELATRSADGSFVFENLPIGLWIIAARQGSRTVSEPVSVNVTESSDELAILELKNDPIVRGLLIDHEQGALEGVLVAAATVNHNGTRANALDTVLSRQGGAFAFKYLTPGVYDIFVERCVGGTSYVGAGARIDTARLTDELTVVVGKGLVQGVLDDFDGQSDGLVVVYAISDAEDALGARKCASAEVAADGHFTIRGLASERYTLSAKTGEGSGSGKVWGPASVSVPVGVGEIHLPARL